ncbi:hypothetical protein CspeluHIS016_0504510 [Cutaneotrichosporon spelunceum]|uniref:Uncharacterized protein n=1 Tax=Cutaneotrichosporon spelunceum TaxID=1672016 RepID=A0AAD3YDY4_9TREE|nr:hypothetical protein CspeluHIS016_0504510 [Cutaneotrichosporon spelunceum]
MRPPAFRSLSLPLTLRPMRARSLASTPRLAKKSADPAPAHVDPAARGVNEMRRQWGGLIDGAEKHLEDEAAASRPKTNKDGKAAEEPLTKHEADPAVRGVNEMHRQWGELVKKCSLSYCGLADGREH